MDQHVHDCLVSGYQDLIPTIHLPDPDDRHVLAAAIKAQAQIIVTLNLKDFPNELLRPKGLKAQSPDDFVASLFDQDFETTIQAMERHRLGLVNPVMSREAYCLNLQKQNLPATTRLVRASWSL